MKRAPMVWSACVVAVMVFALVGGYAANSAAQQSGGKSAAAGKQAKRQLRLPNYYAKVTTEAQRLKLREVLKQYAPRIQQKRKELKTLETERNAALDEILTPQQREEIARLKAAAAQRRTSGSDSPGEAEGTAPPAKGDKAKKAA